LKAVSERKGRGIARPLVYLAVHGVDSETAHDYTERLLQRLDRQKNLYPAFGFAIGSLVPRRSNRALVASIVKGVMDVLLLLPCSKDKPYKSARSHQAIRGAVPDPRVHVVTISGLYGPVPEEWEERQEQSLKRFARSLDRNPTR